MMIVPWNVGFDICDEDLDEDDQFKDDPISQIDVKVMIKDTYMPLCTHTHMHIRTYTHACTQVVKDWTKSIKFGLDRTA